MSHPIVFLDFDGVLNSLQSSLVYRTFHRFDLVSVGLVERLCVTTDALIVVSSAWRTGRTIEDLRHTMTDAGATVISQYVVDVAPRLSGHRGEEIAAWLSQKSHQGRYVILDDDADM